MKRADRKLALGYISAVHGVKGWVKVHSWTRPMEAIFTYQPWMLGEDEKPVTIVDGRKQGKGLAALLPGFDDRDKAVALVGQQIFVARDQLPPTEEVAKECFASAISDFLRLPELLASSYSANPGLR